MPFPLSGFHFKRQQLPAPTLLSYERRLSCDGFHLGTYGIASSFLPNSWQALFDLLHKSQNKPAAARFHFTLQQPASLQHGWGDKILASFSAGCTKPPTDCVCFLCPGLGRFLSSTARPPLVLPSPTMSIKFERDTFKQGEAAAGASFSAAAAAAKQQLLGRDGPIPGTTGKHPITEAIGTAITGGKDNAGTKGYLAVGDGPEPFERHCFVRGKPLLTHRYPYKSYIKQLEENPMRTKMLTAGTLSGAQEVIASWLAKDRNKNGHYFTSRVPKMAAYGALVSAPLGSLLIWMLQKIFKGRTSLRAKILQILVSNLVVCAGSLVVCALQ